MKNNRNIITISTVFFLLLLSGCDDYLDSQPYSFTSRENFYTTGEEAEIALVGCYNSLNGGGATFGQFLPFILNGTTDECIARDGITNQVTPFGLASYISSDQRLASVWSTFYEGINRSNHLLTQLDGIEDIGETRRVEIKGEARFLRGIYHMYLSMMFGAIPVKTEPDPEIGPRNSTKEVFAQIVEDLQFAYETLPETAGISGAATKWAAAGYLARVYAYMGSAKKSGMGNELNFKLNSFDWVDVDEAYANLLTLTTDIVNNSGYQLTENYAYLFRETTRGAQSEEFLFAAEASSSATNMITNRYGNAWLPYGPPSIGGNNSRWFGPLSELFDKYHPKHLTDVRRANNITRNMTANSNVEEIEGGRYYVPRIATGPNDGWLTSGKWRQRDPAQKDIPQWASDAPYPLIRFADVLLLHAEALYENNNEAAAREVLTKIRERAAGEDIDVAVLDDAYYKADFLEELLDERSRELCYESQRRFDLARFGVYDEVIRSLQTDRGVFNPTVGTLQLNWAPYRIWFPIPLAELDLNPELEQNPGY